MLYEVRSLDVIHDGVSYSENDSFCAGYIDVPAEASDDDIIRAMQEHGYIRNDVDASQLEIEGDDNMVTIDAYTVDGEIMPIFTLYAESPE